MSAWWQEQEAEKSHLLPQAESRESKPEVVSPFQLGQQKMPPGVVRCVLGVAHSCSRSRHCSRLAALWSAQEDQGVPPRSDDKG